MHSQFDEASLELQKGSGRAASQLADEAAPRGYDAIALHGLGGCESGPPLGGDETFPARWPSLPADEYLDKLVADISVARDARAALSSATDRTKRRILEAVRPHVMDVDAFACGSFASGTQIMSASRSAIDIVLRVYRPLPEWQKHAGRALEDIARWLQYAQIGRVSLSANHVSVRREDLEFDVIPCWRSADRGATLTAAHRASRLGKTMDPAGHRDLIAARDRSLAGAASFVHLIRIVKHLNTRWAGADGSPPLTSFHIEALALTLCWKPFALAEGVADFLREASRLVCRPLEDPLGTAASVVARSPERAGELLADAASRVDNSLLTADRVRATQILQDLFGSVVADRSAIASA